MDAFAFTIALTLAVAGLFLCRNYVHFLKSSITTPGHVTSMQQVFVSNPVGYNIVSKGYVANGFYPVIEYSLSDGPVSFTAIDHRISGRFHIGDKIKLCFSKSRRSENRICKTVIVLSSMLAILCLDLTAAAFFPNIHLSTGQIYLASFVIAICLAILVLYSRDQDERSTHKLTSVDGSFPRLCLCEPAAYKNWAFSVKDPVQAYKIKSSRLFGVTCMGSALVMLVVALQPLTLIFV